MGHAELVALLGEAQDALDRLMAENDRLRSLAGRRADDRQRAAAPRHGAHGVVSTDAEEDGLSAARAELEAQRKELAAERAALSAERAELEEEWGWLEKSVEEFKRARAAAAAQGQGQFSQEQRAALEQANARLVAECADLRAELAKTSSAAAYALVGLPSIDNSKDAELAAKQAQLDEAKEALVQAKELLDELVFGKREARR